MKKLFVNLFILFSVTTTYSQNTINVVLNDISYIQCDINCYNSFEDSVIHMDVPDNYFVMYEVDLKSNTIVTDEGSGSILDLYKIISVNITKDKMEFSIANSDGISFITMYMKNKEIVKVVHYDYEFDRIDGLISKNIDTIYE